MAEFNPGDRVRLENGSGGDPRGTVVGVHNGVWVRWDDGVAAFVWEPEQLRVVPPDPVEAATVALLDAVDAMGAEPKTCAIQECCAARAVVYRATDALREAREAQS